MATRDHLIAQSDHAQAIRPDPSLPHCRRKASKSLPESLPKLHPHR